MQIHMQCIINSAVESHHNAYNGCKHTGQVFSSKLQFYHDPSRLYDLYFSFIDLKSLSFFHCLREAITLLPTREIAEHLLCEAAACNPGAWVNHSRVAAHCAERIAYHCKLDPEKAYVLGLLHDIGRKFGVTGLRHISDGYHYMMSLGYDEVARVCMTHTFSDGTTGDYMGSFDTSAEDLELITAFIRDTPLDDYDKLIQLCDALSGSQGVMDMEDRMNDVRRRYGNYSQKKWNHNMRLRAYYEGLSSLNLYTMVEKNTFSL